MTDTTRTSLAARLHELAAAAPDRIAVSAAEGSLTRGELDADSDVRARELVQLGVRPGHFVCVVLPNGLEFVSVLVAIWKAGAVPVPLSARLTGAELTELIDLLDPWVVVGADPAVTGGRPCLPPGHHPADHPEVTLDRSVISPSWKAIGSGGSTGRPKVIVATASASLAEQHLDVSALGIAEEDASVVTAPLSHNGPFIGLVHTLLLGGRVVFTGRFDPEKVLATVQRERATWLYLVPTMMSRIWKLPEEVRGAYDLSSLRVIIHMGAPCPAWLKRAWVDWLGPDRFLEMYTSTEGVVVFVATGREWLRRPGTVGLPRGGEVQVRSVDGEVLPPGATGQVWVRRAAELGSSYRYLGASAHADSHGWETFGDIGRLDEDGYLYIEDREADMILVGGSNVYPAEIEAALLDHPAVEDCCVIGLPNDDLGQVPHAIVYATGEVDEAALAEHAAGRLAPYKRPRSHEFVESALRDAAGKVRRRQLRSDRLAGVRPG